MSTDASGDSRPTAERLRELQRLRDDDLISDDEFEAQRARILDEAFGPGQTEMASGSSADGPDGSDADAPSDEGETSSAPNDQSKPDPPGERVVNPARWANWLRITAIVLSGIWIVTIPFMFWRAARFTWLPYAGVATAGILVLSIAVGVEGDEADQPAPAPAAQPGGSATPALPEPTPTRTPELTPERTPVPATTAAPIRTPRPTPEPTPEPTITQADVFQLWYITSGYPSDAYGAVLDFVDAGCEALREGATQLELAAVIVVSVEEDLHTMMAEVLGAGVAAFCPDQLYKFE